MTANLYALAALVTLVALTLVLSTIWYWRRPRWTGFEQRTLWDWISLLSVPMVVGFATVLINAAQQRLADERAAEAAFQQFVDRISALVLSAPADAGETVNAVGRAQSVAILRLVEGERAGRVLAFLGEMDLLQRFAISFEGIDLASAELKGIDFTGLDFEGAYLAGSDLERGQFARADFENADLSAADLKQADLRDATFEGAVLSKAELSAADLRGADLALAVGLSARQLARACYDASTALPPGFASVTGDSPGCYAEVIDD